MHYLFSIIEDDGTDSDQEVSWMLEADGDTLADALDNLKWQVKDEPKTGELFKHDLGPWGVPEKLWMRLSSDGMRLT